MKKIFEFLDDYDCAEPVVCFLIIFIFTLAAIIAIVS